MMIVIAIVGIIISIMAPQMDQARRRARAQQQATVERGDSRSAAGEGQLNTIEVSELGQSAKRHDPGRWVGAVVALAPIIITITMIWMGARNFVKRRPK